MESYGEIYMFKEVVRDIIRWCKENDLGIYEEATKYAEELDITNWAFFMALDDELPIGAVTIASKTRDVTMILI